MRQNICDNVSNFATALVSVTCFVYDDACQHFSICTEEVHHRMHRQKELPHTPDAHHGNPQGANPPHPHT